MNFSLKHKTQGANPPPSVAKYCLAKAGGAWIYFVAFLLFCSMGKLAQAQFTSGSNSPVCLGGTLNLTCAFTGGCPGATYRWTGPAGSGFLDFTQNPSISPVGTQHAGVYSIQAVCSGVTYNQTVTVVINPAIGDIVVTHPACDDVSPVITLAIDNIGGATYSWTTTGMNSITSPTSATATVPSDFDSQGTYSVTVTAAGCTATKTITILDSDIMNFVSGADLFADQFITTYGSATQTNRSFVFTGDFDFTCLQSQTDLTFTQCTIWVRSGAQILVGDNGTCPGVNKKTLTFDQTTVTACDFWNGIVLVGNGNVSVPNSNTVIAINGSFIQNSSLDGVNVTNGGVLSIQNSTMNDHQVNHISVTGQSSDVTNRIFVSGSTFSGINWGGGVGIYIQDVRVLQINGGASGNNFNDLETGINIVHTVGGGSNIHLINLCNFNNIIYYGIYASNSLAASNNSIRITSCDFTNVGDDPNLQLSPAMQVSGYGAISITGNVTNSDPSDPTIATSSPVRVDDAAGAGALTSLTIQNNTFNFRDNGIQVVNRTDGNANILTNTLNMIRSSISTGYVSLEACIYFEGSQGLIQTVTDNTISIDGVLGETVFTGTDARGLYVNGDLASQMFYGGNVMTVNAGIQIQSVFGVDDYPGLPLSNSLRVVPTTAGVINTFTNVHKGVDVADANSQTDVIQNEITLNNYFLSGGVTDMDGVKLTASQETYVIIENTINGPGNGATLETYGIHIETPFAGNPLVYRQLMCNLVQDVTTCLYFENGVQLPLVMQTNVMASNAAGAAINGIHVNNTDIGLQGPATRTFNNQWLNNGANFSRHLWSDFSGLGTVPLRFPPGTDFYPSPLINVGSGTINTPIGANYSTFCTGDPGIYLVGGDPGGKGAAEENETVLETFAKGQNAGAFYEAKRYDELSALYAAVVEDASATQDAPLAQVVFDSLVQNSNIPAFYDVVNLILAGTPDENLGDNAQTNTSAPFANIDFSDEAALSAFLNQPTQEQVKTYLLPENLQKAREILANISATNEIEKNLIIALNYTCKAHSGETLTDGERAEVQATANQCLIPGGRGVAYARALWTWLTRKPAHYADDCVDTEAPGQRKGITEANPRAVSLRLYPNPTRGAVTVDNLTAGTTLEVYDAKGAKVASYAIESASLTVSTANLRGGVYLFRFLNGGNVIATEKVNILD